MNLKSADSAQPTEPIVLTAPTSVAGVWTLMLNRPPVNAMSKEMYEAVITALDKLASLDELSCLLVGSALTGGFCGGADRNELSTLTTTGFSLERWEQREEVTRAFVTKIGEFPYPTVAVLDGYTVGVGFVLASLCDLRFATHRTWFSIPELAVARIGGAAHALRVLPQAVARAMCFQGARLDATEAASYGFLNGVVESDQLWDTALAAATEIARHDATALRMAKQALNEGESEPIMAAYKREALYSFRLAAAERDATRHT